MRATLIGMLLCLCAALLQIEPAAAQFKMDPAEAKRLAEETQEDHENMMRQLGIRKLRPGPSANEKDPNHANYDEALANPFPDLPDLLTTKNGRKVTSAGMWWDVRRPEIVEDFEREVLGRVPPNVPAVKWTVVKTTRDKVGPHPVVGKRLAGRVDNASFPSISVEIDMILVTPAEAAAATIEEVDAQVVTG